jgi:endo-1,4-beta-xylanase
MKLTHDEKGTTRPDVEYYIIENWTGFDPSYGGPSSVSSGAQYRRMGNVICDGVSYSVGVTRHSPLGGTPTTTHWSVRSTRRTEGTVDTRCHLNAWTNNFGLRMGTHAWQTVATEGYLSSGSAEITVAEVN